MEGNRSSQGEDDRPCTPRYANRANLIFAGYSCFPLWAQEPEAASATGACITAMGLRYRIKGNVIEPIPSPDGLPQDLQGKFLWLNLSGEAQSAIRQVYVAGTGWVISEAMGTALAPCFSLRLMRIFLRYEF